MPTTVRELTDLQLEAETFDAMAECLATPTHDVTPEQRRRIDALKAETERRQQAIKEKP